MRYVIIILFTMFITNYANAKCLNKYSIFETAYTGGMEDKMVVAPHPLGGDRYIPLIDYVCSQYYILEQPVIHIATRGNKTTMDREILSIRISGILPNSYLGETYYTQIDRAGYDQFELQESSNNEVPLDNLMRIEKLVKHLKKKGSEYDDTDPLNPGFVW